MAAVSPVLPGQAKGPASQRLGRYQLLAKLASGGMATVYVGRVGQVAGFEQRVAIKLLHPHLSEDPQIRDMFLDEARVAARIRHANVVPVTDVGQDPVQGTFLVMDYIEGCDLSRIIRAARKRKARLSPKLAARIAADLLAGLQAAHELRDREGKNLGVVHRDISPHNVLVGLDGIARVTDFGIAKAEGRISSTKTGQLKGKLAYMPPERLGKKGARIDDLRGDLFASAIVLWESLTGRRLFKGEDDLDTVRKVLNDEIPTPSSVRPELAPLDEVVMKGLARDPDERYQTAREFLRALEDAAEAGLGGLATRDEVTALMDALVGDAIRRQRASLEAAVKASEAAAESAPGPTGALSPGPVAPHGTDPTGTGTGSRTRTTAELPVQETGGGPWKVLAIALLVPLTAGLTYFVGAKMSGAEEQPAPVVGSPPTITTVEEPVIEEVREDEGAAIGAQADAVEAEGAEAEGAEAESAEAEGTEAEGADGAELAEGEGAGAEEGAERAAAEAESDDEARRRAERRRARRRATMAATMAEPTPAPTPTPMVAVPPQMDEESVLENPYAQ
ncbi:MAG TPA: serine/threonine-protein kinase [Polyangiaceae bacterium LLY-WYZ-15_(1-7)]|nr:serine/threonine-protein kinase [Polyangiaceae bacterium LLY-WYZ-15_(1-7)]HJL04450.1 serine/threonine-protein kinase [Polyangiaceae bacterium LLY-WYZ-15_(1-7)]HJL07879.1 serine/threonine-protein kinase [Polyangiaceae bacterium LLY-WYZ-15_(1-7)]HJL39396.1 serine/threonine-protein kinase [Polyangiaceae bacterium LLY-WYZ-15_(1-7)]